MFVAAVLQAQTLENTALNGKYFVRQIWLASDGAGNVTDGRSLLGAIIFDGRGNYSFTGQQVHGSAAPAAAAVSGTYQIDPAGGVALSDPLQSGQTLNARYSQLGVVGAATEITGNTFELLVAIPAPGAAASNASLNGSYWVATLEFPGASAAAARNTLFSLSADGQGHLGSLTVTGHEADQAGGAPLTETLSGASYAISADGAGAVTFGTSAPLVSGSRTIYVSSDGNLLLGGSAGGIDLLIGVKAATGASNASWHDFFWGAGLRVESGAASSYAGSAFANSQGKLTWSRRLHGTGLNGAIDFTGAYAYQLNAGGAGTAELAQVAVGAGGNAFVGAAVNLSDPQAFELYCGLRMPSVSGSGVFVSPQGVTNAASSAPPGNPIAPGEYITIYGSGLASGSETAKPPYPPSLNGVSVLINGRQAPLYFVSPGQINALVPYATQGPQAAIVVETGNGGRSNTVTVPVAPTAPGVFSQDLSGSGPGAILHADYSLVTPARPAHPGETVLVYLTGLGAVNPGVADGTAGGGNPLSLVAAPLAVYVGGSPASVQFAGLAPGFPGLYQINITIPADVIVTGSVPLAIQTPYSFHDQVDIPISAQ